MALLWRIVKHLQSMADYCPLRKGAIGYAYFDFGS